jgi:predicted naringenin-chalcone synthase
VEQQKLFPLVQQHYRESLRERSLTVLEQVLAHPSIATRYIAVDSLDHITQIKTETADERMDRFTRWAVALSQESAGKALAAAGLSPADVTAVIVSTCTGYICPGIATYLVERMGLPARTRCYDLVGAGCGGALPALQVGESVLSLPGQEVAVCVAVEICSATFQMADDVSLLISNAIFGDGAAAAVLTRRPGGLGIAATASRFLPAHREDVRFVYKNGALHNRLSPALPEVTGNEVSAFVRAFLAEQGLSIGDVDHWAVHSGGDKILNALQERLGLGDPALAVARDVLLRHGNMSSPTVLFELEQIMRSGVRAGERCLLVAFGAGMSMHATLLESR